MPLCFSTQPRAGLSLPRKSAVRLTDRPDMTLMFTVDVKQQCNNLEQRQNGFARGCVENYSAYTQNTSIFIRWLQRQGIDTSPHENLFTVREVMNNFLNHHV